MPAIATDRTISKPVNFFILVCFLFSRDGPRSIRRRLISAPGIRRLRIIRAAACSRSSNYPTARGLYRGSSRSALCVSGLPLNSQLLAVFRPLLSSSAVLLSTINSQPSTSSRPSPPACAATEDFLWCVLDSSE
jgi:hypothetical protein